MGDAMVLKKKPSSVDEMNLKSIQRLDPCAVSIVDKSTHAALYRFDKDKSEWVKTSVDGPLFLYKRADKPVHSLIIANRLSLEDHIEPITPPMFFFLEPPYVFVNKPEEGDIRGFWFFEEEDCKRFHKTLVKLVSGPSPSPSGNISDRVRTTVNTLNGCNTDADAATGKENSCKTGDEMPALLQQLLCKETIAKLPVVPTRGAMSADQIEKQFLLGDAENGGAAEMSSENVRSACRKTRKHVLSSKAGEGNSTSSNLTDDLPHSTAGREVIYSQDDEISQQSRSKMWRDGATRGNSLPIAPLTKEQLLAALKHLLKDDGFVTRLHHAYLDSIQARLGLRD